MTDDYDDPMTKLAFEYGGADVDAAWQSYREKFAVADKDTRINELRLVDTWLENPKPRKDVASIWQKKRDLLALNENLLRLGR